MGGRKLGARPSHGLSDCTDTMTKSKKTLDPNVEQLAAELHSIYQSEVKRLRVLEPKWPDSYKELPEYMKDLGRAIAKYMLAMVKLGRTQERAMATEVCRKAGHPELAEQIEATPLR